MQSEAIAEVHQACDSLQGKLEPKVEHNESGQIKVSIESSPDSDWTGCNSSNTTMKNTSGSITMCWSSTISHQQDSIDNRFVFS
eukprot:5599240-Amphidinium_carterae.4